jgi:hypothetical protein
MTATPSKRAYRVNDSLVCVNGILYSVTHTFVVKEVETESTWLDEFTGGILECYNCFGWGSMDVITVMGSHRLSETVNMSMIFAVNNLNYKFEPWTIGGNTYYDLYGDSFGWEFAGYTWDSDEEWDDFDRYTEMTGLVIGGKDAIFNGATDRRAHFGGGNNQIITLTASTPSSGKAFHVVERWHNSLARTKDMVMWLYDFSFTSGTYANGNKTMYYRVPLEGQSGDEERLEYSFQRDGAGFSVSDALFQPGQQGRRIISNHYKEAPWLRYPHLM